jgi:hypothetical protein
MPKKLRETKISKSIPEYWVDGKRLEGLAQKLPILFFSRFTADVCTDYKGYNKPDSML